MNARELVLEALNTLDIDQAALAKRLKRSQATVSRWLSGDITPDYESCLRLAHITGTPARVWLAAAGLDPLLVPDDSGQPRPALDPRLAAFLAEIEASWQTMDAAERDLAERVSRAAFSVPPAQRRAIGRQDPSAKRREAKIRELEGRSPKPGDPGTNGALTRNSHHPGALRATRIAEPADAYRHLAAGGQAPLADGHTPVTIERD